MAVCPKCKNEIDCLSFNAVIHHIGVFKVIDDFPDYGADYVPISEAELTFDCPECNEELFSNDSEAMDFLEGESIGNG